MLPNDVGGLFFGYPYSHRGCDLCPGIHQGLELGKDVLVWNRACSVAGGGM